MVSFSNFFKCARKTPIVGGSAGSATDGSKYAKWSKEQLVERIIELERDNIPNKRRIDTVAIADSKSKKKVKKNRKKEFDYSNYSTRFIALKFAYLGWNYNGLAIQKEVTKLPTVEGTILEAMNKCKLIPSMVPQEYNFSRCGRTDKGVSAMNQVISLRVRSNLTEEEQMDPQNDVREIQYVTILNQLLPADIRVFAVSLRPPPGFDARFSCKARHYKYIFHNSGLNLTKMEEAAKFFEGEHDFRNFCKIDGSKQITNYKRTILSAKILKISNNFYCFDLIGSAFLWHQVRCMMANLFLVGQELEEPQLIPDMMDVVKTPQKPIYEMASDVPLLLYDCKFPDDVEWIETNVDDYKSIKYGKAVDALTLNYQIKTKVAEVFKQILHFEDVDFTDKTRINLGDGKGKIVNKYEKMMDREVMQTVETINAKFKQRKDKKK
ncbi:hypothetical protein KAFR_0B01890 [Kazachstania africana CBS 2517]|uniref:Pseudouridine synthase I TruA alpha/beta domain-containing protein n=1 Tax=Kazachstania africana (strain ATCC 22294 / BCRC 22015 / CBS 2517 / CECT 1963 / NBRC 1671 / NRRL Y-8276) TaxID=1071382 RepID=H2AQ38_KAZAF|nr:hypothetical protein KAFR_0B01890 [Kazachstania africana CBS 2517]CCF56488.1 hypothetical protein KAFR_0B01890 [Kazachstania africana CBS 2517]